MRCKKHHTDISSSVGVCASCLRERLFFLIEAQARAEAQAQRAQEDLRLSDTNPPPLVFPRSVSPYITPRKSDTATWHQHDNHRFRRSNFSLPDEKFFSTPQVGPNAGAIIDFNNNKKKKFRTLSLFSHLFRSKSEISGQDLDPGPARVSDSRDASSSSPSWFSAILPGRRQKQVRTFALDESAIKVHRRRCQKKGRGMSPAMYSDDEHCDAGSSGYSSESSQGWKQTPRRTPARRSGARQSHNRNVSGIAFCLSPLVRASPNPHWNQKGLPPEVVVAGGGIRLPVKSHLSPASFFCKNRSRKLADFGRSNRNR